jgi:TolB-like protein
MWVPAPFLLPLLVLGVALPGAGEAQEVRLLPGVPFTAAGEVRSMGYSADDRYVAVGDAAGYLTIRDLERDMNVVVRRPLGERPIRFTAFLAGDSAVVVVDESGEMGILPLHGDPQSDPVEVGPPVPSGASFLALDSGRRFLAVARPDHDLELLDLRRGATLGRLEARGRSGDVMHVGFDRHGRQLISLTNRGDLTAWDPGTLQTLRRVELQGDELHGSRTVVHWAGADRGANVLVVGLEEVALPRGGLRGPARPTDLERRHQLLIFDWFSGGRIRGIRLEEGPVEHMVVGPGNDHASVAANRLLTVHNLRTGEVAARAQLPSRASRVGVSPGDRWVTAGVGDGQVLTWEIERAREPSVEELDRRPAGLLGRIRVLGPDAPLIPASDTVVVAILPFDARDGGEAGSLFGVLPELLTTQLANLPNIRVVERLRIQDLLDELALQEQGITEADGLRVGQMLNADFVLLGSVGTSGLTYTVGARLLQVETGEAVGGRQILCEECRGPEIFEAIYLLGETLAR